VSTPEALSPTKRAILELRELRRRLDELERARSEPVAVIGVGCRFPGGADSPDAFWRLLCDGVDAITEIPRDRFDVDAYYDPDPDAPGRIATRWGGFLDRVDAFDAEFFGITPREAVGMDPQQRLLLEVAWEALEHAGQAPGRLAGSPTGVFVGIGTNDYAELRLMRGDPLEIDAYLASGSSHSVASGRLSYLLGLVGPSLSLDTACSSSLVAVHLAVQSLRAGECRMALAGGVNLILLPEMLMTLSKAHMMAADGRCKAFDARADGFVRAEGCGMVVLKRLADALAEGDSVLAVVRGSAVNQDGRTSGLTAPNGPSQESVIRAALADAGVAPADVSYVETHGTGTALGDPIEAQALGAVLREGRPDGRPAFAGSVKTNLGHLEAAAGVAGLIKAVLAVARGRIPPNLHLLEPSPLIPWDDLPFTVPTRLTDFPEGVRRVAGVSSFGFSGTNAHVVLEEAPTPDPSGAASDRPVCLLPLSARSDEALRNLAGRLARHLDEQPGQAFADVCFTAGAGRSHLAERLAVVASDRAAAARELEAFAAGGEPGPALRGRAEAGETLEATFLFTGQGSHYPGMARRLWETEPAFARALERCDEALQGTGIRPPTAVLFPAGGAGPPPVQAEAQPALVALELALAALWRSLGIEPALVLGHSLGEIAAAQVAGALPLPDALALALARGRAADAVPEPGEMWVVRAGEEAVAAAIAAAGTELAVAAVNDPTTTVVSGRPDDAAPVVQRLAAEGVEVRRLDVPYASHSALMEPVLDTFAEAAARASFSPPAVPIVSSLTGELAGPELLDPAYWRRQLREPVRFAAAVATLARAGQRAFVELGPRPTLCGMGSRAWPQDAPAALWLPSLRDGRDDLEQLLETLGALYVAGAPVDWSGLDRGAPRRRVPLPTYPFERKRYWLEAAEAAAPARGGAPWEALVAGAAHEAERGPLDLDTGLQEARWEALDRLATAAMAAALRELGAFTHAGEEHGAGDLVRSVGADPMHERLLARWLARLAAEGLLEARPSARYASPAPLGPPDLDPLVERARALFGDNRLLPEYVERCARRLPAILAGRETALEALFPGGSFETAEHLYESSVVPRYANGIVRGAVETIARTWPAGRPLRAMEIGAGTGGTTATILPVLPRERATYLFTDLSDLFLARAAQRFEAYPFVRYRLFDAEGDPAAQGVGVHAYDLVVAANVLHATRDLRATLAGVRTLLAPGGVLLLYETTAHPAWFDVTIGLIEGWSRFEDDLRGNHPLLPPERWREALLDAGFEAAEAWPEATSAASGLGVHVIAAHAPAGSAVAVPPVEGAPGAGVEEAVDGAATSILPALELAPPEERADLLVEYVRDAVVRVTRSDPSRQVGRRDRLMDVGVDSLMAVELARRLEDGLALAHPLPATLVFDHPTIEAIAAHLDTLLGDGAAAPAADDAAAPPLAGDLEGLSDADVEELLLRKLGGRP
jgi:acyl transferase domain-containing protein/trans-aconitate methyltransferase